jgi:hypothetical protein
MDHYSDQFFCLAYFWTSKLDEIGAEQSAFLYSEYLSISC